MIALFGKIFLQKCWYLEACSVDFAENCTRWTSDSAASKSVAIAYGSLTANTTTVGPGVVIAATNTIANADGADTAADTLLGKVAEGLGNIAADLTALKAFQGAASATGANMAAAGARLIDTDFALETASLTKNAILNQAALAMAAQANAAQSSILSVLQ